MQDAALARSLLPAAREAAREAGAVAKTFYRSGARTAARVWSKSGGSPVTEADLAANRLLKDRLSATLPEAGWLSEESTDSAARLSRRLVWVVDPIDGTRAFSSGHPDWSIVIALLVDGRPVLGIVYAPAHGTLHEAVRGEGARRDGKPIRVSTAPALRGARVAGPKPLVDQLDRAAGPLHRLDKIPSLALRIARVADGSVDLGLVSANAHDWDIAASDLILTEAGGHLTTFEADLPAYNQAEPMHGELVAAPKTLHPRLIEAMTARHAPVR
jgi:myo-inositol-1(or 4)-monophosphatase